MRAKEKWCTQNKLIFFYFNGNCEINEEIGSVGKSDA